MYSPLLENEGGGNINTNYSFSKKNSKDPELALLTSTTTVGTSYDNIETAFEINGGSGSPFNNDDNNSTTSSTYAGACCPCIPQVLKSALAILLGIGTIVTSILCYIFKPVDHPTEDYVVIYVMAAFGILNSLMMIWYEKSFIFSLPTSRRALILLVETRKLLKAENHAYTKEIEVLERNLNKCEEDESKLRGITQSQSSSVDELVRLVLDNEKTLDMIRDNLRQVVIMDAIKIIINDLDPTQVIDHVMAKSLAAKIKTKVESSHGILFDEDKFLHALATNSTFNGAIRTIKELLPEGHIASNDVDKGNDIYDMFYLSIQDSRQLGSVYAARAILSGTNMSLAQSNLRAAAPVKRGPDDDEFNENTSSDDDDEDVPEQYRNRLKEQWHQFCMMSFPFFKESGKGRCLFGTLLVLTFVNSGINVYFSYLIRDFNTALSEKEVQKFYQVMMKFILSMIVLIPLQVSFRFIRVQLGIAWRKWLTERVLKLYFSNKVYYGLERQAKAAGGSARDYQDRRNEMDNPDQRIQEDVNSFTNYSLSFFLTIVNTAVDLVSFCFILWSIMPQLFIAIILFAGVGTLFTILIGKVLIKLNYESLQREADFRFNLVRIRENAESIAFYGGEAVESNETGVKFDRVIDNMTLINWAQLRLDTFTETYNHIVNILPIFILAHQYFTGIIEFGVIAQSRQAFWHVLNDLSIIIHEFNGIASFMAGIDRLFLFMKAIQELDPDRSNDDKDVIIEKESFPPELSDGITVREVDTSVSSSSSTPQSILTLQNVQLTTPDNKRTLFRNLNLRLTKGQNLLIAGVSGAGKSSLLRAIAGLWDNGDGEITRTSDVYFLPQRPYWKVRVCTVLSWTLRDQLLYPSTELGQSPSLNLNDWSDEALLNILNVVDLPNLASIAGDGDPMKGIHSTLDWSNTLSLGEQQRLAFGRLLINRPKLVIMDESTSALDVVAERRMYTLIRERLISAEGVPASYVSVGHRPTLLQYHDIRLLLRDGQGIANFIEETEASADEEAILASRA